MIKCENCGKELKFKWKYCPKCGEEKRYDYLLYIFDIIFAVYDLIIFLFKSKYGAMILLANFTNINFIYFQCKKEKFKNLEIILLIFYEIFGIIIGNKLLIYIINFYKHETISFSKTGFSSYGAIIGILLMLLIYKNQFKKDIWKVLRISLIPVPIMYAIGKIGCAFAGCCYGIEYSGIWHVTYYHSLDAPNQVSLFPIQIIETIFFTIIFGFFFYSYKTSDKNRCSLLFIVCGITKFILDFFRANRNQLISINQWISIVFIILGITILLFNKESKL